MRPTSALQMLSEGPPTCLLYLRKALEHFITNGCLSLQYIISFAILIGYPTSGNFVQFERVEPSGKHHNETHKGQTDAAKSSSFMYIHLLKALEHFISNSCVSLQCSTLCVCVDLATGATGLHSITQRRNVDAEERSRSA